jgi:hypothetical protein
MKFRKLRIAFSVTCAIACVLLIVLWVRSYWWEDDFAYKGDIAMSGVQSAEAGIGVYRNWSPDRPMGIGWVLESFCIGPQEVVSGSGFVWEYLPSDRFVVAVPYWFPTAILATLAVLPWIRHFKWRFTTRTLLIATTLVAVVLGAAFYSSR